MWLLLYLLNIYSTDEALSRKFLMKHYQSMFSKIESGLMLNFKNSNVFNKALMLIEKDLFKHRLFDEKELMINKLFKYFIFRFKLGMNRSILLEWELLKSILR